MATYSNSAREVEMPNGDVVVLHSAPTGGANTTSNIKKFKYDDNGHVTESTAADAEDLNLNSYSTPTTGSTAIGTSDDIQTAIGKLDHQSQIDQSNILYTLNRTGKNLLRELPTQTINGVTLTNNGDGTYTITRTATSTGSASFIFGNNDNGRLTGCKMTGGASGYGLKSRTASGAIVDVSTDWTTAVTISATAIGNITVNVDSSENPQNVQIRPFACDAEMYEKDPSFTMPALPNYDLTRLEAEDRASLAEVVDSGAKNLLDFASATIAAQPNATATKSSDNLVASCTAGWAYVSLSVGKFTGNCKLSFKISELSNTGASPNVRIGKNQDGSSPAANISFTANGTYSGDFVGDGSNYYLIVYLNPSGTAQTVSLKISEVMVCTKAAFGVSNKFVPFGNDPFYQVPINHNMIYRGRNLGASLTDAQHTALSSGNFTDLYLGDYWTKTVTIPAGTYTGGDGEEVTVPAQTNITLKAVIADFDTFYAGYASTYAGINTHHAAVIVTGFSNVVWNKTNSTTGGYVASLIHKWLVGSALPQIETWFGSAKVLSHQKLLTNAITGDAASGWAWSSQKISLLSENQMYGSKVWGNSKAANGGYEPGEAHKHLNVFNHIDANLLFGNKNIWLRDIASAVGAASLGNLGGPGSNDASGTWVAPAALILLS